MKYRICVPIQVNTLELEEITSVIREVTSLNPDFIELRLDYIHDPQKITKSFLRNMIDLIQPKIPVICTFRDSNEGGKIMLESRERIKILKLMIDARPKFLDLEMNSEKPILNEIVPIALNNKINLIFSYHDFTKTPTFTEVNNLLDTLLKKLNNELKIGSQIIEKSIFKLIFMASSFEDNLIPLQLCKKRAGKKTKLISFCMGDLGFLSRIFSIYSGSYMTYCSYKEKTAPGQITINELRDILKLLNIRE
ncbi:MAG: type I 3-dehydroquinate dehydratase [Promethearchaeota archaeon]|jgi:3-dehydroquinate dehydratase-1